MQAVDVLSNHAFQFSCALKLCQFVMSGIGLCFAGIQVFSIIGKEDFRLFMQAVITQQVFRFVSGEALFSLAIKAVIAAEVRDAALGRYAGAAKEGDMTAVSQNLPERVEFLLMGHAVEVIVPLFFRAEFSSHFNLWFC